LKSTGLSAAKLSRSHSRALPDGRFVATRRDGSGKIELVVRTGSGQASVVRRAVIEPPIPERIGSATFLAADGQGRLFVRVEVLNSENPLRVRRFVSVYDAELKRVGTFEYPLGLVTPPEDDVQVDAAGRVYVLLSFEDRFELRRFEP
jgi:hypothetical protein